MQLNRAGLLLVAAAFCGSPAAADESPLTYERIELSVSAEADVDNDTLQAVLYAQHQGTDAAVLAGDVNREVLQAVAAAKQVPDVKVQTLSYQTSPVYDKQRLVGWRVQQSIRIESRDAARLSELIGELQATLAVQSIGYSISAERRLQEEDRLIGEAISRFNQRAQLISRQLGYSDYRLVQLVVDSSETGPPPFRAMVMEASRAASPPVLEAGTQKVEVRVRGTIELQLQ
jgi:predicted secreted protein